MYVQKINPKDIIDYIEHSEVSTKTGELINRYTKALYSEEKLEKDKKIKDYLMSKQESHKYINEKLGYFYFYFYTKVNDIKELSNQYKTRYIMLSTYLAYDSNKLVGKQDGKGNVNFQLNKKDLKVILKLSDSEFLKTIKALEDFKLIYSIDGNYYINNDYCVKGENVKKKEEHTRIFIESFRIIYRNTKSSQHKQLYSFFLLIPYINIQSNILCKNINEEDMLSVVPINSSSMAEILGVDKTNSSKLYNDLRKFKVGEEYVIGRFDTYGFQAIIINPKVYYSGDDIESLDGITTLFAMAKGVK